MVALNQPRIIPYCDYRDFGVCPVLLDCLECLDLVSDHFVFFLASLGALESNQMGQHGN